MAKINWDVVMASHSQGGLNIGSLVGFNLSLLLKWKWRFAHDEDTLWVGFIKNKYEMNGGFGNDNFRALGASSWFIILATIYRLISKQSWSWRRMVRGGIEQSQLSDLTSLLVNFSCLEDRDRWWWSLDPQGLFSVKSTRCWIDKVVLPSSLAPTRWNKLAPRKVNILIGNGIDSSFWNELWCGNHSLKEMFPRIYNLETDKRCFIASRIGLQDWALVLRRNPRGGEESGQFNALKNVIGNISLTDHRDCWQWSLGGSAGFTVASIRSLVDSHSLDIETINHTFFNCDLAKDLWFLLAKWWELDIPVCGNITEWYDWLGGVHVSSKIRLFLEGGCEQNERVCIFDHPAAALSSRLFENVIRNASYV
ncbi:hypothetical protein Tco_0669359 [Tanacetum coccineum]